MERAVAMADSGDARGALEELERALMLEEGAAPTLETARLMAAAADALRSLGAPGEAVPRCRQALAAVRTVLGPGSPREAAELDRLAAALLEAGRAREAADAAGEAAAVWAASVGRNHPLVADALVVQGRAQMVVGLCGPAAASFRRAGAVRERSFSRDDPRAIAARRLEAAAEHALAQQMSNEQI